MSRAAAKLVRGPALIAGASSGIGAASAYELAVVHAIPVVLGGRRMDKLTEVAQRITDEGGTALAIPLDVTDGRSIQGFVSRSLADFGEIGVLVSSAGTMAVGRLHETSTAHFQQQIQVHLIAANRLAQAVLPAMIAQASGDVIFIGSDVGLVQRPHLGAYGSAKAALTALAADLQAELAGTGVRISIVHPGPTRTDINRDLSPEAVGPMLEDWVTWGHARHPRFLRAEDIARAVAFVAAMPRGTSVTSIEIQPEAPLRQSISNVGEADDNAVA